MCNHCYGDLVFLGCLGKMYWYRCRDCGMEFSSDAELGYGYYCNVVAHPGGFDSNR